MTPRMVWRRFAEYLRMMRQGLGHKFSWPVAWKFTLYQQEELPGIARLYALRDELLSRRNDLVEGR